MNIKMIMYLISWILKIEAAFMIPPLLIAIAGKEREAFTGFLAAIIVTLIMSAIISFNKPQKYIFYAREGFVTVALSWILMSFFGCLPFYISGQIPGLINSFFETVSGFTTTGSSILTEIETLDRSILYWRSFTNWLGGMGVLVFLLAIIPLTKGKGHSLHLLRAESPGPVVDKLVPKLQKSAKLLYGIYVTLTVVQMVLLMAGGMPGFDSVVASFSTAGTGGFAIKNASIAAYDNYYMQSVVTVFMVLFGINFNVFYLILAGEFSAAFRNEELKVYLGILFTAIAVITLNTRSFYNGWFDAFHHAAFQSASIMTTTGFATVNFDLWPELSRYILIMLMFVGACAGSTGGGIKISRIIILFKSLKIEIEKMMHPNSVKVVKLNKKTITEPTIRGVNVFMIAYTAIVVFSILIISVDNFSFETTVTSVIACINNIGPGLDMVGPSGNFSEFSDVSKLVLCMNMLLGRLEIFPLIMLFAPSTWKQSAR
ncbi:TrkH family potassium uptake protein [Proteocatella sphenisci]|uniref:TrkH family potassium uptake protein n=1 Tax=Proteocatella sphenisci TaxID=181070 RepID=UPI0004906B9F|nr:TrkH family potassium uptake protein [Proteocatella sphenisci]